MGVELIVFVLILATLVILNHLLELRILKLKKKVEESMRLQRELFEAIAFVKRDELKAFLIEVAKDVRKQEAKRG